MYNVRVCSEVTIVFAKEKDFGMRKGVTKAQFYKYIGANRLRPTAVTVSGDKFCGVFNNEDAFILTRWLRINGHKVGKVKL